jgi:DNA-binding response OmpR family regulator
MGSILVIEDERGILGLIEAALTRFGHQVETAEDGKEGIRKFDRGRFDMVITDYVMPEMNGEGVLEHIRRSSRHRTPIIGMSGTPWLLHGAGFDLVLAKPFPLNQLVELVKSLSHANGLLPGKPLDPPAAASPSRVAGAFPVRFAPGPSNSSAPLAAELIFPAAQRAAVSR